MSVPFNGIPSLVPIQKQFHSLMNITPNQFNSIWDKLLTMITKTIQIDIIKLDDILHDRFGEYENENKSMTDIITEKYGKEANDLVERLIS